MYVTKHGQLHFSEPGNEPGQCKIEPDKQQDEEANKETQFFLTHYIHRPSGWRTGMPQKYEKQTEKLFARLLRLWYLRLLFLYAA